MVNGGRALITMAHPAVASAETIEAMTTYSGRDRLIARVQKASLPTANDIARFAAEHREVRLDSKRSSRLDSSDCDLVRAISTQVFTRMAVSLADGFHCSMGSTRVRPSLRVLALVPADDIPVARVADKN